MAEILSWLDEQAISQNPEIESRNLFARKHQSLPANDFLLRYIYLSFEEMIGFLRYICADLGLKLSGHGIELGAGCSAVSNALLKIFPDISSMHAVEIVPDVVKLLQPKVVSLAGNAGRCVPVFGSFDEVRVPSESLDFAVEFDAFHHSNNLDVTLKETARILKPGGTLLIIDRVHHDTLPDVQKEYLLNIEYPESFKETHGMPVDAKLTRRDNGEHEIRRREWFAALERAGFTIDSVILYHRRSLKGLVRNCYALIPFSLRQKIGKGQQFVYPPIRFLMFYLLPFLPMLWRNHFRPLKVTFSGSAAFQGKSVIVARRA